MPITANTPTPQRRQRRQGRGPNLSWIIFLAILARPLWGVIRSALPAQISNAQILIAVAGVAALAVMMMLARVAAGRSRTDTRLATPVQPPPSRPLPRPGSPASVQPTGAPRFEPVITGKVVLAGAALLAVFAAAFLFIVAG